MTAAEPFAYDAVFYPGSAFAQTHPDRLATVASLFGMQPAAVPRCRVLELGCGAGNNLIPMAHQWPGSEFLGIDLSAPTVAVGAKNVAELGLKNIELRHCDIMDVSAEFGRFDYIIAHGVYSWVPPFVRDKILGIFKENLARQGVAYVSYNAYPGSHLRDLAREMMLFHVRFMDDPKERVQQSRALIKVLADASPKDELYGVFLEKHLERVRKLPDEVLYHDDLDASATPFLLHQLVEDAAQQDLQYLSEATFAHTNLGLHPERLSNMLKRIPEEDFVTREQYLDFFVGRWFRETLLCHDDIELNRNVGPQRVMSYHVVGYLQPVSESIDPSAIGAEKFKSQKDNTISTDHRLSKAAFIHLGRIWPRAISFPDLAEAAVSLLSPELQSEIRSKWSEETDGLATLLLRAYCGEQLDFHLYPPPLTTAMRERPEASLLARWQATKGEHVTNLRHGTVHLEDEIVRRFLPLVDGTRTIDELASDLGKALRGTKEDAAADGELAASQVTRERVEEGLRVLATLALLAA